MQRIIRHIALAILLCATLSSCFRRPLHELDTTVLVDINIETDITNYEVKSLPKLMRVIFYDHDNGAMISQNFVGPEGGPVKVLPGRTYDVVCYNFDTEVTFVENENRFSSSYATTNLIPEVYKKKLGTRATSGSKQESPDQKAVEEEFAFDPDHLFVGRATDVYVPTRGEDQAPVVIGLDAKTVVESWIIELTAIKGQEYIGSMSCVITGLAAGNWISYDRRSEEYRTVYFETVSISEDGFMVARFNTFGLNPAANTRQRISLIISDLAGKKYPYDIDVTEQFRDNPEQIIRIETDKIVIEEPEHTGGGGMNPDVDEWEDIVTDIEI